MFDTGTDKTISQAEENFNALTRKNERKDIMEGLSNLFAPAALVLVAGLASAYVMDQQTQVRAEAAEKINPHANITASSLCKATDAGKTILVVINNKDKTIDCPVVSP